MQAEFNEPGKIRKSMLDFPITTDWMMLAFVIGLYDDIHAIGILNKRHILPTDVIGYQRYLPQRRRGLFQLVRMSDPKRRFY